MELTMQDDFKEIERTINAMGKVPQRCVTKAAKKGATVIKKAIQAKAPVGKTGYLQKGISIKGERSKTKGKKVYQVYYSEYYNQEYQKPIYQRGKYGGRTDHAYYPASVEYGFLTSDKSSKRQVYRFGRLLNNHVNALGKWREMYGDAPNRYIDVFGQTRGGHKTRATEVVNGFQSRKVPGQHIMRDGMAEADEEAEQIIIVTFAVEVEKEFLKQHV